jgi:hypothetical protein
MLGRGFYGLLKLLGAAFVLEGAVKLARAFDDPKTEATKRRTPNPTQSPA